MSRINETLKRAIDEIDLDKRADELVEGAERVFHTALERAAAYTHEHRDDIDRRLDRLGEAVEERTEGRFTARAEEVRGRLDSGLDRLAAHHTPEPSDG